MNQTPPKKKRSSWALWLILLLLLLTFLIQWQLGQSKEPEPVTPQVDSTALQDSLARIDSLARLDSLRRADSLARVDSLRLDSLRLDSLRLDSLARMKTTTTKVGQVTSKSSVEWDTTSIPEDTLAPTLKISPVSGRYFDRVTVEVSCLDFKMKDNKKVSDNECIVYHVKDNFDGDYSQAEVIPKSQVLTQSRQFRLIAKDSAGNFSPRVEREYKVVPRSTFCGKNAVPVGGAAGDGPAKGYCVDQYEWPNQEGEKPKTFLSQAEAVEACQSVGKRLCSSSEWQGACQGPSKSKYPYGQSFEASACVSSSQSVGRSGRKKDCRSWYGAYDMGGNVWEWTSTPSPKRNKYFIVSGGSWSSVNQTSCTTTKYSFFPQNQYPMVGFRCCSDQK